MPDLFIGLMSGTSLDGVDGVIADFSGARLTVLQHASEPFDPALKSELLALNRPGNNELHRAALAANALARRYAAVVQRLLERCGVQAGRVAAIGAHGQTVRHRPGEFDGTGYTLQLNQPALLAELTGIRVVCDFRSRDVAAGGQGAPLVPAFHREVFGRLGASMAVLNIGGIANLSVLAANGKVTGFDCGPGNGLMDHWCQAHMGQAFDEDGSWAATGKVSRELLAQFLCERYFSLPPPKSTGRDLFHADWLSRHLSRCSNTSPADVQATLAELTASAIVQALFSYGKDSEKLIVCGGGALNGHLMGRIAALLPSVPVESSTSHGLPPLQVEAAAFAWLAREALAERAVDLAAVTGALGNRVLGAIYPP
ncbi:MAG: anhydro-N-acetylmuramic acid kinase [Burkholderiales bacterium]